MFALYRHIARCCLGLLAAVMLAAWWGGAVAALAAASMVLAVAVGLYWLNLARLVRWLHNPKQHPLPSGGSGVWAPIFDTLQRQAKSHKKRKQKQARALQRFNRAAEAMPNGIIILDRARRIEWLNRQAVRHFNLHADRDRHRLLPDLLKQPELRDFLECPLPEGAAVDETASHSLKIRLPEAQHRRCVLLLTRTAFEAGAELLISQDITAAEQLNATRTSFVANVSHELRTPLTVINGFLETLADFPDLPPQQRAEFVGLMQQEGQRMLSLLADLLTLSRLESHDSNPQPHVPLNLSALAAQVAQEAQTLSQGRHRWAVSIDDDVWVAGIQADLYSALSNMAFNAVRYTPEGGAIELCLQEGAQTVCFSVRDNGPGIAAEHLPRLTERFYRVDAGRDRRSGGTGLGLAITKHALAEHGSSLQIDSEPGVGSCFSTRLQRIPAPAEL